jgi:uncharacterized protein (DUF362 family)
VSIPKWFAPERWSELLQARFSRRSFLRALGLAAGTALLTGKVRRRAWARGVTQLEPRKPRPVATLCPLAAVESDDPGLATRRAVEALGGMARFVKKGDVVVVKPNIGWDRTPEQAGNTNPEVVAALVAMSLDAGAKSVRVFDNTCNDARRTYANSGIQDAVKRAGGQVSFVSDWKFYPGKFPAGSPMADWPIYRDAVECDCFINVPVAKNHRLSQLTLSMKNLMGVCGSNRGNMHRGLDPKLTDLTAFIRPDLTVVDAYRILLRNGPTGGDLEDVANPKLVIASADPVLADAYATTLFGMPHDTLECVRLAAKQGLGSMDVKHPGIKRFKA